MYRFESKIEKTNHCWFWRAGRDKQGYGVFWDGEKNVRAHRFAYELWVGLIPEGQIVRHTCHTPSCVNPDHLTTGTHQDNSNDKVFAERHPRGGTHGRSVLSETQVKEIYEANGTNTEIACAFNVDIKTIWLIRNNKTWVELTSNLQLGLPINLEKAHWVLGVREATGLYRDIAHIFRCSPEMVGCIKSGKSYSWLDSELLTTQEGT